MIGLYPLPQVFRLKWTTFVRCSYGFDAVLLVFEATIFLSFDNLLVIDFKEIIFFKKLDGQIVSPSDNKFNLVVYLVQVISIFFQLSQDSRSIAFLLKFWPCNLIDELDKSFFTLLRFMNFEETTRHEGHSLGIELLNIL